MPVLSHTRGEMMANDEFDGKHCPSCGSTNIQIIGDTLGQDTGDDGLDYNTWLCRYCNYSWVIEMSKQEYETAKKERWENSPFQIQWVK